MNYRIDIMEVPALDQKDDLCLHAILNDLGEAYTYNIVSASYPRDEPCPQSTMDRFFDFIKGTIEVRENGKTQANPTP